MRVAALALFVALTLAAACSGEDAHSPPDASATSSPVPSTDSTPPPAPHRAPTSEELTAIEEIARLAVAGDESGLRGFLAHSKAPCELQHSGPGGGPVCKPGEPPGTLVDSIDTGRCDGALARTEDVTLLPPGPVTFVAAFDAPISGGGFSRRAMFVGSGGGRFYFTFRGAGIIGVYDECISAPLVVGRNVLQWIIPPAYTPFVADGAFVRVLDEAGEPFLWRFPGTQPGEGYRVYWDHGTVLACGPDRCGEQPLDAPETVKRLAATTPGTHLCVRGWRDDAGNIEAHFLSPGFDGPCVWRAPETGISILDKTMAAVADRDSVALLGLIEYRRLGCVEVAQLSTPPQCQPGQPVGTLVDTFNLVLCDGGPITRMEAEQRVTNVLNAYPLELYAAVVPEQPVDGERYRVVFSWPVDGRAFWFNLSDTGIIGLWGDCGASPPDVAAQGDFLIGPLFKVN